MDNQISELKEKLASLKEESKALSGGTS